jgi:carbon-monoxide dehydrogenase large subunit/6-hydroxypseudooxynicotine dehydrogenase subunit gamma
MSGSATFLAAQKIRAKALNCASQVMQAPADELEILDGLVRRRDQLSGPSISLGEVAAHLQPGSKLLQGQEPGLAADAWFYSEHMNYPYGVHLAVARVDRETGEVRIERYFVAYDVGRAVNPMLIEGQIVGGVAQGLGGALFEEFCYDERGEPLSTTFADYLIPTAHEIPPVEVLITQDAPSPLNPLGLKGAGEGGTNAVGAAIAAAVDDAIRCPGAITQLPITPRRLKAIIDAQQQMMNSRTVHRGAR